MGTISEKLVALGESKAAIRQAIIDKGVDVPSETTFRDYAVKISEIEQGGGSSSGSGSEWSQEYYESVFNSYQRPSDWLDIETLHPLLQGDQKFIGLMAVHEESGNFTTIQAVTSSGTYRVDWGDGTTSDHDSSVIAYKTYDYDNISESTLCSRGYRQAIVTVIPISGDLLSVNLNNKHTQAGLPSGYSTKWLDIRMAGLEIDVLSFNASLIRHYLFERFAFVGTHSITSMMDMFSSCSSLQTIPLLDTSSVRNMMAMFSNCSSLQTIPLLDTSLVTSMDYMFSNCPSLQRNNMLGTKAPVSYTNCLLSKAALVIIFNNLATATGQTITITGNYGASLLTAADRLIATDKGWTIIG